MGQFLKAAVASGAVVLVFILSGEANAVQVSGFVGPYAPTNWTLVTNGGDGSVNSSSAPSSITLTGANNSRGSVNTDYIVKAVSSGQISFDYNYTTTDIPGYDGFGYLINGSYTRLTDRPASGSALLNVVVGDVFGYRINSTDSCCGAGKSTISNFSYPSVKPVPGPLPVLAAAAGFGWAHKLRRRILIVKSRSDVLA